MGREVVGCMFGNGQEPRLMLGAPWYPYFLIKASQWSHKLSCDLSWFDRVSIKPSVKADLAVYSYLYCHCVRLMFKFLYNIKWISFMF